MTAVTDATDASGSPVERVAQMLAANLEHGVGGTLTWLNHYSALCAREAGVPLHEFDYLGLDGILLCRLQKNDRARTTAQQLLPGLLGPTEKPPLALVGAPGEPAEKGKDKIEAVDGREGR